MRKSLLNQCLTLAKKKLYKHPQLEHYPHFSFIIVDNQICGFGTNNSHEPDKKYGYHKRIDKDDFIPKTHSEADALRKCRNRLTNKWEIVNIRLSKAGLTRLSCPCSVCLRLLLCFNCSKIYFSTPTQEWGIIKC